VYFPEQEMIALAMLVQCPSTKIIPPRVAASLFEKELVVRCACELIVTSHGHAALISNQRPD